MKNRLVAILFIAIPLLSYSQKTEVNVAAFSKSVCEADSSFRKQIRERIIDKEFINDIVRIKIGVWATCCVDYKPKVALENNILYLDIEDTEKKAACECGCYYHFIYTIVDIQSEPVEIRYKNKLIELSNERYETYTPVFKLIKGDTVDFIDRYGLRQGKWRSATDSSYRKEYFVYEDGLVLKKVNLYESGEVKIETIPEVLKEKNSESHYGNKQMVIEYYRSGMKRKECVSDWPKKGNLCKEWNEKGILLYQGIERK